LRHFFRYGGVDANPATESVYAIFASIPLSDHRRQAKPRTARNLQ